MHYAGTDFAADNKYTIIDKKTDEPVERNYEISPQDFELLNKIYPSEKRCSEMKPYNLELIKEPEGENEVKDQSEQKTVQNTADAEKRWILVLNTHKYMVIVMENYHYSKLSQLIIDGKGQSKEIDLTFGPGTEVKDSCSVVWRGKMFIFGGYNYKRQI